MIWSLIGGLFSIKRALVLGAAVAGLLVAAGPYLNRNAAQQNVQVEHVQQVFVEPQVIQGQNEAEEAPEREEDRQGQILQQLELEEGFAWRKDWWKYMLMAMTGLLTIYCSIRLANMIFRFFVLVLCLAVGFIGAIWMGPMLTPLLEPHLPERVARVLTPAHAGYVAGFVLCYLLATMLLGLLPKRCLNATDKKNK